MLVGDEETRITRSHTTKLLYTESMNLTKNIRKILRLIDSLEEMKVNGHFQDLLDNVNSIEESLRHLSKTECEQLSEVRENEFYKNQILQFVGKSELISQIVKERIQNGLA